MRLATLRLRRVLAAGVLGVGTAGGVVGLAAGTASAATYKARISAASAPSIGATAADATAGSLAIVLPATGTGGVLHLKASAGSGTVDWVKATVTANAGTATLTPPTGTSPTLVITVTKASGTTDAIHVTHIGYKATKAHGTVSVTPTLATYAFTPTSVVNAKAPTAAAGTPATQTLKATSAPFINKGGTDEVGGSWTLKLSGTKGQGWASTATATIKVATPTGANCKATTFLLFTSTPKVTVAASTSVSVTPTVSASLTNTGVTCTVSNHNELRITFTKAVSFTSNGGSATLAITGVRYDVGSKVKAGSVTVSGTGIGTVALTASKASNAVVATHYVTANTPAVTVAPGSNDTSVSPVDLVQQTGFVPAGDYVCTKLTPSTNSFSTASKPKVTVTHGNGTLGTPFFENASGAKATAAATATYVAYKITSASTTASTYSLSNLGVTSSSTSGAVKAVVTDSTTSDCASVLDNLGTAVAFTVGPSGASRIYGNTLDATAAQELETVFPATSSKPSTCPGTAGNRPVVLATDTNYPDALASQYLAGYLGTGTLLTPIKSLSTTTKTALRNEGITHVFIVGGAFVVSTTVVNQLKSMSVYKCGGKTVTHTAGTIQVTRISGQTEYDTAKAIANRPPQSFIGTASFPLAYAGTNATGGNGKFNDTAGKASVAPSSVGLLRTAIVATGQGFADAESASTLAYRTHLPVLLTTPGSLSSQASAAIQTLKIKQVIVMGGQFAVSNTVVTTLQGLGVSVLRVAGKTYTDTAVQLAKFEYTATATSGLDWAVSKAADVTVARGDFYSDGLAGAVVNGNVTSPYFGQPLLLTFNPTTVGNYLPAFLKQAGKTGIDGRANAKIANLTVLGGPLAVTQTAVNSMETDLQS